MRGRGRYRQLMADIAKDKDHFEDKKDVVRRLLDLVRYMKNYEATLERNGKTCRKYRFSDEREWRYVPHYTESCKLLYTDSEYALGGAPEEAATSISTYRLKFTPNDVKYIIIKSDKEIGEFIEHLRHAKGKKYSQSQIERLTTRLFTSDQIHKDI